MTRGLDAVVGVALLFVAVAACLPAPSTRPQPPHALGDLGLAVCEPDAVPALLCNATTKTSPPHECVICPDPARHCLTSTATYCATSCDEPLCERRK